MDDKKLPSWIVHLLPGWLSREIKPAYTKCLLSFAKDTEGQSLVNDSAEDDSFDRGGNPRKRSLTPLASVICHLESEDHRWSLGD